MNGNASAWSKAESKDAKSKVGDVHTMAGTKCPGKRNVEVGVRTIEEWQRNKGAMHEMLCSGMQDMQRNARHAEPRKRSQGHALLQVPSKAGKLRKSCEGHEWYLKQHANQGFEF